LQKPSNGSMTTSSVAGSFVSRRPKIAPGLLRGDRRHPGTADTKNQSRRGVGGTSEARNGVCKRHKAEGRQSVDAFRAAIPCRRKRYRSEKRRQAPVSCWNWVKPPFPMNPSFDSMSMNECNNYVLVQGVDLRSKLSGFPQGELFHPWREGAVKDEISPRTALSLTPLRFHVKIGSVR
jgi:hypothetical protein